MVMRDFCYSIHRLIRQLVLSFSPASAKTNRLLTVFALLLALGTTGHAAETITYYHWDALGSPVAATDETGNLKWREEYQPYGERIQEQASSANNTRWYTGHPHDNATGLSYMGARWYDPVVGRFMGVDPQDYKEGELHSFNRFAYGNNNPYRFVDPDGRASLAVDAGVLLLAGGIVYVISSPEQKAQMNRVVERVLEGIQSRGEWGRTLTGPINNQSSEGDPDASLKNNPMLSKGLQRGFWPADEGSDEWGRRNGIGAKEGRGRFHGIKQDDKGKPKDKYGVNPDTGEVVNPEGEVVGKLGEAKPK